MSLFLAFFWGFSMVVLMRFLFISVMSYVGCDYRQERKGVADDDHDDSPLENFDDENDN